MWIIFWIDLLLKPDLMSMLVIFMRGLAPWRERSNEILGFVLVVELLLPRVNG